MNAQQLRTKLAQHLHRHACPDAIWKNLEEERYIAEALDPEYPDAFKHLVTAAKKRLQIAKQLTTRRTPPGRKATAVSLPPLPARERERADTLALWLERHVASIPRIKHLRQMVCPNGLLSVDQARRILTSVALRFLSWSQCTALGIPLAEHETQIVSQTECTTGRHHTIDVTLLITWESGMHEKDVHYEEDLTQRGTQLKTVYLPGSEPDWWVEVWPHSGLDELTECASWLAGRYPWEWTEALWFLLTGKQPRVEPVMVCVNNVENRSLSRYQIVLTVDPWVSAATVQRVYRAVQDIVHDGKDNRPLGERSLTLVRFVADERSKAADTKLTLKKLLAVWNCTYPQWAYDHINTFHTALSRAEMAVRFPIVTPDPRGNRSQSTIELHGHHPLHLPKEAEQSQH